MYDFLHRIIPPPIKTNADGAGRRVGIEIEFAGLSAAYVAQLIAAHIGGKAVQLDPHRFDIVETPLGTFRSELDSRFVHPETLLPKVGKTSAYQAGAAGGITGGIAGGLAESEADRVGANQDGISQEGASEVGASEVGASQIGWYTHLSERLAEAIGTVGGLVIPCEVITPPVPIGKISEVDDLLGHLKEAGAQGTGQSIFYAFGVHLNPEVANRDPNWLLNVMRAYIVLAPWLRSVMEIDTSRYLTGFAMPYGAAYIRKVLDPAYKPDLNTLITDYLHHNPSRDHELDMLPLFATIQPDTIRRALPDQKISARPTFHYRLPNAALERPDWSIVIEWNRWCLIERLAQDQDRLAFLAARYLASAGIGTFDARMVDPRAESSWARFLAEWLVHNFHERAIGQPTGGDEVGQINPELG